MYQQVTPTESRRICIFRRPTFPPDAPPTGVSAPRASADSARKTLQAGCSTPTRKFSAWSSCGFRRKNSPSKVFHPHVRVFCPMPVRIPNKNSPSRFLSCRPPSFLPDASADFSLNFARKIFHPDRRVFHLITVRNFTQNIQKVRLYTSTTFPAESFTPARAFSTLLSCGNFCECSATAPRKFRKLPRRKIAELSRKILRVKGVGGEGGARPLTSYYT